MKIVVRLRNLLVERRQVILLVNWFYYRLRGPTRLPILHFHWNDQETSYSCN